MPKPPSLIYSSLNDNSSLFTQPISVTLVGERKGKVAVKSTHVISDISEITNNAFSQSPSRRRSWTAKRLLLSQLLDTLNTNPIFFTSLKYLEGAVDLLLFSSSSDIAIENEMVVPQTTQLSIVAFPASKITNNEDMGFLRPFNSAFLRMSWCWILLGVFFFFGL